MFKLFVFISILSCAASFLNAGFRRHFSVNNNFVLRDASGPSEELINSIKAKKAANPNFDPFSDPETMQQIQAATPDELREYPNAIERLIVAFKDTTSGQDGISDLNSLPKLMTKQEAISSPQSKWFKEGFQKVDFDKSQKSSLRDQLRAKYPGVNK